MLPSKGLEESHNIFECLLSPAEQKQVMSQKGKLTGLHPTYMEKGWVSHGFLFGMSWRKSLASALAFDEKHFLFLAWGPLALDPTRFKLTIETRSSLIHEEYVVDKKDILDHAKKIGLNKATFASFLTGKDPLARHLVKKYCIPLFDLI